MKKVLAIGLVVILLVAAVAVVLIYSLNAGDDDGLDDGEATVYIENASGVIEAAQISLDQPDAVESTMLAIGQGIRSTAFKPLASFNQTLPPVSQWAPYRIWAVIKFKVSDAPDIGSLSKVDVYFAGHVGKGDGTATTSTERAAVTSANLFQVQMLGMTGSLDTSITADMSTKGKFSKYAVQSDTGVITASGPLYGNYIHGFEFRIQVNAFVVTNDGSIDNKGVSATLKLTVSSWTQGEINITIEDVKAGGPEAASILTVGEYAARTQARVAG